MNDCNPYPNQLNTKGLEWWMRSSLSTFPFVLRQRYLDRFDTIYLFPHDIRLANLRTYDKQKSLSITLKVIEDWMCLNLRDSVKYVDVELISYDVLRKVGR